MQAPTRLWPRENALRGLRSDLTMGGVRMFGGAKRSRRTRRNRRSQNHGWRRDSRSAGRGGSGNAGTRTGHQITASLIHHAWHELSDACSHYIAGAGLDMFRKCGDRPPSPIEDCVHPGHSPPLGLRGRGQGTAAWRAARGIESIELLAEATP